MWGVKRWISMVLVFSFLVSAPIVCFHESLLTRMGQWLSIEEKSEKKVDLVVALGGEPHRKLEAVRLLEEGVGQRILFVGATVQQRDYLLLGVPVDRIVLPPMRAFTTYQEALTTRQVLQDRGLQSILI